MACFVNVALLAEGVDRNPAYQVANPNAGVSPSSRRAWIEISREEFLAIPSDVALLAEGVDRNTFPSMSAL